jgi:hypothetical protein
VEENILNFVVLKHYKEFEEYEQTKFRYFAFLKYRKTKNDLLVYQHDRENY